MFLPRYGLQAVLVRWRGRVPPIPEAFLMSPGLVLPPGWLLMVPGCPASAVVTPVKVSGVGFNVSGKGRVPTTPEAFLVPPGLVLPPGWLLMVLGCPAPALVTPVKVSGVGFDVSGKGRVPPVPEAFLASPVSVIPAGCLLMVLGSPPHALVVPAEVGRVGGGADVVEETIWVPSSREHPVAQGETPPRSSLRTESCIPRSSLTPTPVATAGHPGTNQLSGSGWGRARGATPGPTANRRRSKSRLERPDLPLQS